eukprot:COSAG06_NODE_13564_length_1244_cov_1.457642_1_plen_59_part_00
MQQAYGTVPANEDVPLVRDDGASSDDFSAVEAGSVTASSNAEAACPDEAITEFFWRLL